MELRWLRLTPRRTGTPYQAVLQCRVGRNTEWDEWVDIPVVDEETGQVLKNLVAVVQPRTVHRTQVLEDRDEEAVEEEA